MNDIQRRCLRQRKAEIDRLTSRKGRLSGGPVFGAAPIRYEVAPRDVGIAFGGIGAMRLLIDRLGLAKEIDSRVAVLKMHLPYHESDHVLALAINALCGGRCIEDLELRRRDVGMLRTLGVRSLPDPTTAGDFCRRFDRSQTDALMEAFNAVRLKIWKQQPREFFEHAVIDGDGTVVESSGHCKEGVNLSYCGKWGYQVLALSLAQTGEPLSLEYREGNRPSSEGATNRFDQALALVREAGFRKVTFRGDTDFTQSRHLDRWDEQGVRFIFGLDAKRALKARAHALGSGAWRLLERPPKYKIATQPRAMRPRHKRAVIAKRAFKHREQIEERVAEFTHKPDAAKKAYRVVVLRKLTRVVKGQLTLENDERFFFFITNDTTKSAEEIVLEANGRCGQEKLFAQLKSGVGSLRTPLDSLQSNTACALMMSLAWSLKAWLALSLPIAPRWKERHSLERKQMLGMAFRTFLNRFMQIPALVVRSARRIWLRLVAWNDSLPCLLRVADALSHSRLE